MVSTEEWSLRELIETLNQTARTDKDNLVGIDGLAGTGKSTLAVRLCKKGCPWFNMKKDILYSRDEMIEWVTTARPGSWGLADEVVNALFKRDFAAKQQKFLLKILDMCRDRNLTLIMCLPNFWSLDKHILDGRLRLRMHVARTGLAFMWKPSTNPFAPDRWYRKYNEKVCQNWDTYQNARRTKGFIGFVRFGDLQVREKAEYLAIKARKKEMIKEMEERQQTEKALNKKQSLELGKMITLIWLSDRNLLKRGWEAMIANDEGVTVQAIAKRIKDYRKKLGEESEPDEGENQNEESNLYIDTNTNDNFESNYKAIQHSAE